MNTEFKSNATVTRNYHGSTPFILGCDTHRVLVEAGTRCQILEEHHAWHRERVAGFGWVGGYHPGKPYYKVRIAGDKPDCYWTLWLGSESYPAIDVVLRDQK